MITEPTIQDRTEQPHVAIRAQAAMGELDRVIPQLIGEVGAWLGQHAAAPAGAPFVRYLVVDMEGDLDIEVGFPVAAAPEGSGRVTAGVLPGGRYASILYTGPYDGVPGANMALGDWAARRGLAWDTRPAEHGEGFTARLETYRTDPAREPDPAKWETEVAIRLADGQAR
jgi:effector-binding domain-containing protein